MSQYYDKEGKPIDLMEWCRLFEDNSYKIIKRTELSKDHFISTVWLGLDHSWGDGPPLIFETMAFPSHDQERYSTLEEAIKGHEEMVNRSKAHD